MVKIIETNISLFHNGKMVDSQSRVIEVESWDDYVDEIKQGKSVDRQDVLGSLYGNTLPKGCKVSELSYTYHSLTCLVEIYDGKRSIKSAYLVNN